MTMTMHQHRGFNGKEWTGVSHAAVREALQFADGPLSVKDIGAAIGIDMTVDRNIKAVSNSCGYLLKHNLAHRVGKGIYQAGPRPQEGKAMTMTEMSPYGLDAARVQVEVARAAVADATPEYECEVCGKPAKSEMGLKAHMTRSHPKALSPDEAFERTGQALEVLFPNGIPMSRLIELADLQKAMLRAIK